MSVLLQLFGDERGRRQGAKAPRRFNLLSIWAQSRDKISARFARQFFIFEAASEHALTTDALAFWRLGVLLLATRQTGNI